MRDAAEEPELDRFALLGRKPRKRVAHAIPIEMGDRGLLECIVDRNRIGKLFLAMRRAASQNVERAIAGDPGDPRAKVAAAKERRTVPNLQEHGLRDILSGARIGENAERETIYQAVVRVIEGLEGSGVTGAHALHEPACIFHGTTLRCTRRSALLLKRARARDGLSPEMQGASPRAMVDEPSRGERNRRLYRFLVQTSDFRASAASAKMFEIKVKRSLSAIEPIEAAPSVLPISRSMIPPASIAPSANSATNVQVMRAGKDLR